MAWESSGCPPYD
jgi:hypothetical protein